jgi:putative ATP-dependent endonuclease of OLD family
VTLGTLDRWVDDPSTLEGTRLIRLVERVGKGRFAQLLAPSVSEDTCPGYIRAALQAIRDAVA